MKRKRSTLKHLYKICDHPRSRWSECPDPWHFAYKHGTKHYRFSLDKRLGKHVDKETAEIKAGEIWLQIKSGTFDKPAPITSMTLQQLIDVYLERYVGVERTETADDFKSGLKVISGTRIKHPTGGTLKFGEWAVADIRTDTIERYRETRRALGTGIGGTNRSLSRLRAVFNWGIKVGYLDETPFERKGQTVVKMSRETPRNRRLNADIDEEAKLLAACEIHLRALVECALQTGMRRGEITNLRWRNIRGMTVEGTIINWAPRASITLEAASTKTKRSRSIPISTRLKAVLEIRRFDPAGEPLPLDSYVFGNALGQKIESPKRAWMRAVLKAHGIKPTYTKTMNMSAESRAAFQTINLHFHDLRREAGSRWLDGGVPLHTIRDWLGHSNISQTSTYLAGTSQTQHDAMEQYEKTACNSLATNVRTGGKTKARTDTRRDKRANKTAVRHEPAIM
jgi:integrase